jgi:hypothetical protein
LPAPIFSTSARKAKTPTGVGTTPRGEFASKRFCSGHLDLSAQDAAPSALRPDTPTHFQAPTPQNNRQAARVDSRETGDEI